MITVLLIESEPAHLIGLGCDGMSQRQRLDHAAGLHSNQISNPFRPARPQQCLPVNPGPPSSSTNISAPLAGFLDRKSSCPWRIDKIMRRLESGTTLDSASAICMNRNLLGM
jgi:hypothetical protein